jgi:hypothetical protein
MDFIATVICSPSMLMNPEARGALLRVVQSTHEANRDMTISADTGVVGGEVKQQERGMQWMR